MWHGKHGGNISKHFQLTVRFQWNQFQWKKRTKGRKGRRKRGKCRWNVRTEAIRLTLATYVTEPVTRAFGWCLHCVLRVDGTPRSSSDGALISSCSGAEIAPLCELGRWGGCGAGLFLRCLNVLVPVEFVPVIDVPPLPSAVVSGSFSRISSFSCCMFVFCGNQTPSNFSVTLNHLEFSRFFQFVIFGDQK